MSIIFVHEIGHFTASKYYKWNIDRIYIYPLGGVTKFNDHINRPLKEELIITLMGPIFQILYCFLLEGLSVTEVRIFNIYLLIFNLLPILPLDGGKLVNIFLFYFISYKKSYKITLLISFITYFLTITFCICFMKSIFIIIILILLIFKIIEEYLKINYYFNKFLLERYLIDYRFKKHTVIDSILYMRRDRKHLIKIGKETFTEKEALKRYFSKKKN